MGVYNPNIPQILGQEWVPILESPLTLTPSVNVVELGHGFSLSTARIIQTARFYVQTWPPGDPSTQAIFLSVYNRGTQHLSGPVRSVIVPCSLGTVSLGTMTIVGATTIAQALANPSDSAVVNGNTGSLGQLTLRFETDSYMPLLVGKRILGINFLYTFYANYATDAPVDIEVAVNSTGATQRNLGNLVPTSSGLNVFNLELGTVQVGEVDYHWNAPSTNTEKLPWSPTRLRGWDNSSGATDRFILLTMSAGPTAAQTLQIGYAALEIFFCEEQRVLWGGKLYSGGAPYVLGVNQITMRDLTDAANPTLPVGNYDLVISSPNQQQDSSVAYPELNQIRELYPISSHPSTQVDVPFPIDPTALGKTFIKQSTRLIPQLSLHTSGGPLTEVHVYGRQAVAQVYGTVTATQEIYDAPVGATYSYPWVRYYARRFGTTSVPLKLSSPTITGSGLSVEITPSEFDALDEIVDGWKEITLRFDTAPSMGAGTNPQWRWSATGEVVGSRWEVLGAIAPALSGAPGNLLNLAPSPNQLSVATYGMPVSGANINLGWVPQYAPPVSATVDDQTSDAALMFARDFPVITGFSVSVEDQQVVGIGLNCGLDPCCVPTEIQYNLITWGLPVNAGYGSDTFSRTVAPNEWGTAESGQAWNESSTVNTVWEVTDGQGVVTTTTATSRYNLIDVGGPDQDVRGTVIIGTPVISSQIRAGLMLRATDSDNGYMVRITMTSSAISLDVLTRTAGTDATLASINVPTLGSSSSVPFKIRAQIVGNRILAKVWASVQDEPGWLIDITDNSFTTGDNAGILVRELGGNTTVVYYWDDFSVGPPDIYFGSYELQRMDTVTTTWQTIMSATSPLVTGFSDYEARVGIMSSYRIRAVDLYDFPGPWSSTVTATIEAPGVTIGCDDGHLLIFTSNEEQDGSINLAYSSVWEASRTVEEGFTFNEANFVQLQAMYNRDFFTAFRPTERGGERFERTVLVQAAAIAPETLADFTGLRDMAWADVPYICVRDEDGNRWFATVLVPSGRVLRDRRLYLAPVDIIEVTDVPSQVDP